MQDAKAIGYIPLTGYHYRQSSSSAVHSLYYEEFFLVDDIIHEAGLPLNDKTARAIDDAMRLIQLCQLIGCVKNGLTHEHEKFCHRIQRRLRHEFLAYQKLITYGTSKRIQIYAIIFALMPYSTLPLIRSISNLYSALHSLIKPEDFKRQF